MAYAEVSPFEAGPEANYSVKKEFGGSTVLITGASGYIGSLLVEQLLRTTDVNRVYVLMRGKRGCPAQERLQNILHSGLFHLVRDNPALLQKVHMLEGDLNSDNLGLTESDLSKAVSEVEVVIHSAASIELEADVQHTLYSNYLGTRRLLNLAMQMQQLRCFLHVSTAYVNINQPRGSSIEERIYPLKLGSGVVSHAAVVEDLLSLEADDANVRAQMFLDLWDFPNTYTMGKHLTEQQVAEFHRNGLPVAIVRPTLVCGLAGDPYPGYCGNLAGPIGMGVAMATGLFDYLDSVAMVPTHVWDAVPSDLVTSVILAAAAAVCAGVHINEYKDSPIGNNADPMIVHAGTSTTYPISFAEAAHGSLDFIKNNPPPFRLPGGSVFKIPLDYRPDERAVERRKAITAWKVWLAVKALTFLGQHKTAKRLKYGHMAWAIQNNAKTDRNLFFDSRNLKALDACLDPADAASGHYTITWTLKNGGWTRYIGTNLAGLYRLVFGMADIKGLNHDFKFIPNKPLQEQTAADATAAAANDQQPLRADVSESASDSDSSQDMVEAGLRTTASMFASIPASGSTWEALHSTLTGSKPAIPDLTNHLGSLTSVSRPSSASQDRAALTSTQSVIVSAMRSSPRPQKLAVSFSHQPQAQRSPDVTTQRDTSATKKGL